MRPRRGRCRGCGVTHVLLLVDALLRRADTVAVIGAALVAKAAGRGHRAIATRLGRPPSTVRGWLRRFGSRAEPVRAAFTALAVTLVVDAVLPESAGRRSPTRSRRSGRRVGGGPPVRRAHRVGMAAGDRGQHGPAAGPGLARRIDQHELALGSRAVIGKPRWSAMSTVDHRGDRVTSASEQARRREQAEQVAYWRYQLIRDAADPGLSPRARGRLVRSLAATVHTGPFGTETRCRGRRWTGGSAPGGGVGSPPCSPRRGRSTPRTPAEVLDLAAALKREQPDRTAAQVARILRAHSGWSPSERTLLRHFDRLELRTRPDGQPPQTFGRFEAEAPNIRWVGDALHGPKIAGRKTYLFCFLDDHSRAVMGARWGYFEDTVRLAAALRHGLAARGVPKSIYVDNGSAFVDAALKRAAAKLGIRIIHSTPYRPEGKGKIERFFETVRAQFLVEIGDGARIADLDELNRLFVAWVETVYHRRVHDGTGQTAAGPVAGRGAVRRSPPRRSWPRRSCGR